MRLFVVVLCLFVVTACYRDSPVAPINQEITLAPGQAARINGTGLSVTFTGVSGDSRCPADALCVLGGSATVRVEAADAAGGRREVTFETGDLKPVAYDSLTLELLQLAPYPFSAAPIKPGDYRATMRVTR